MDGLLRRFAPRNDEKKATLLAALRVRRSTRERAAVLFLGRGNHFQGLIGTWYWRARGEDVPLVFDLVGRQRGDRVHLMHQLMIRGAEIALPRLEQIVLRAL